MKLSYHASSIAIRDIKTGMSLLTFIYFTSAVFGLFIAISFLGTRAAQPSCARILGINYLLIAVLNTLAATIFSDSYPKLTPHLAILRAFLTMLLGPALYMYFISVFTVKSVNTKSVWPHLLWLPAMALALMFGHGAEVDILIIGSFFGYATYILKRYLVLLSTPASSTPLDKHARRWLGLLLGIMFINLVTEIGVVFEIRNSTLVQHSVSLHMGSVLFLGFHILAMIMILVRSPIIEWMHELKTRAHIQPKPSTFSNQVLQSTFSEWEERVATHSLHLNENSIPLSRAARQLGVPSRQLSQAINVIYGASYSQYLNDKRVEQAKCLLTKHQEMSITDIYLSAGFSTKSHFHREFTRCTGMTPSEYRKQSD